MKKRNISNKKSQQVKEAEKQEEVKRKISKRQKKNQQKNRINKGQSRPNKNKTQSSELIKRLKTNSKLDVKKEYIQIKKIKS